MDVDDNNDIEEALCTAKDQEEQPKEGPSDTKEEHNDETNTHKTEKDGDTSEDTEDEGST